MQTVGPSSRNDGVQCHDSGVLKGTWRQIAYYQSYTFHTELE